MAVVISVYPISSHRMFRAVNFFRSLIAPEFWQLGLLHEAAAPSGFPWICWFTVWRILADDVQVVLRQSDVGLETQSQQLRLRRRACNGCDDQD
jgi:hypothetical protein